MTTPISYVDLDFVKGLDLLPSHDIDAVEALYPGSFDDAASRMSRRFDGRRIDAGTKSQIGALVAAELLEKRGEIQELVMYRIKEAADAAEAFLATPVQRPSYAVPAAATEPKGT